jgi:hypothetical protein
MKLKIISVLAEKPVFNGTSSKTGKPYSIYGWAVNAELDGVVKPYLELKSMSAMTIEPGKDYEVKEENFKGNISYQIQTDEGSNGWQKGNRYSRPVYTLKEYDSLFDHAVDIVTNHTGGKLTSDNLPLISTYIISAVQSSVKVHAEKVEDNQLTGTMTKAKMFNAITDNLKKHPEKRNDFLAAYQGYGGQLEKVSEDDMQTLYFDYGIDF